MALTVRDAARLLSTDEDQVHRWIASGEIPFDRGLDQIRLNRSELLEWATTRRIPLSAEVFRSEGHLHPRLVDALQAGGVHHQIPGATRESVLRAIVDRMPLPDPADNELVTRILLAREQLGSSAIGEGIAIPHVRHPLVFPGGGSLLTLSFLATPLDFGAPDGAPVFALFTMISPTIRKHLQLLARLAAALHDQRFRAVVAARASADAIVLEARRVEAALSGPGSM